jgi:anti-sigma regulatory factor (Ser/Thr protein kinase)
MADFKIMILSSLTLTRTKQFWIFQLLGWSLWVFMLILRDLIFVPPEYIFSRALVFSLSAVVAVVLTSGLRYLYKLVWEKGFIVRFLVTWFGSFAAALLWQPFQNYIALIPFGELVSLSEMGPGELFDDLFSSSFPLLLLWSGLYFIIKYYQLFQAEKEKSLRSDALAHEAQLLMLRYQLNPHFLFNTLNAISTLVLDKATVQANEMLTKLSKFLRYSLEHAPLDKVTLAHEIETSRLYLDIEKVRFAERLKLEINVASQTEEALVPSLILQPLIENSIKHAVSKSEEGGLVGISASVKGNRLLLEVSDEGPGVLPDEPQTDTVANSTGVGLSNIRNRLQQIYGANHELTISAVQPRGCKVTVNIPYDSK